MTNRMNKMLDLLIHEHSNDHSSSADMLREMVETAGSAVAQVYGDRDIKTDQDRADFLNVLDHFTVLLWCASVPLVYDDLKFYRQTLTKFALSMKQKLALSDNRIDVLQYYAKCTRNLQ